MQITAMTPALAYGRGYTGVTNSRRSDSDGRDHLRAVIRSHGSGGGGGAGGGSCTGEVGRGGQGGSGGVGGAGGAGGGGGGGPSIGVYKAMGATPVMTMTTIMIGTGGAAGGGPRPGMVGTAAMTYP